MTSPGGSGDTYGACPAACTTPTHEPRFGQAGLGLRSALDLGDKLPPSPSDPQLNLDLRKTALLRSLLLRTEARGWRSGSAAVLLACRSHLDGMIQLACGSTSGRLCCQKCSVSQLQPASLRRPSVYRAAASAQEKAAPTPGGAMRRRSRMSMLEAPEALRVAPPQPSGELERARRAPRQAVKRRPDSPDGLAAMESFDAAAATSDDSSTDDEVLTAALAAPRGLQMHAEAVTCMAPMGAIRLCCGTTNSQACAPAAGCCPIACWGCSQLAWRRCRSVSAWPARRPARRRRHAGLRRRRCRRTAPQPPPHGAAPSPAGGGMRRRAWSPWCRPRARRSCA